MPPSTLEESPLLPGPKDITLYQGDTYVITGRVRRNVGTETEPIYEPVDLTGHEGMAQVRRRATSSNIVATWEVEFTDPVAGEFRLTLPASESKNVTKDAVWDFQTSYVSEVDGEPTVLTWLAGTVTVINDVSRVDNG